MSTPRHGGDKRGNSRNRRDRKRYLLSPAAGFGGDGHTVPCVHRCGTVLTYATVEADRIIPGGSYGFTPPYPNVQPSCGPCNKARSTNTAWAGPALALTGGTR